MAPNRPEPPTSTSCLLSWPIRYHQLQRKGSPRTAGPFLIAVITLGNKSTKRATKKDVMDNQPSEIRLPRRQFIANLLFAGSVVTLAGLQSAEAQQNPTDGWTLPDLNKPSSGPTPKPTPRPKPPKPPRPLPPGKPRFPAPPTAGLPVPPSPRGRVVLPGDVSPPQPPPRR